MEPCYQKIMIQCIKWVKVFKNGPSKICARQPFKKFEVISAKADHITTKFLKTVFQNFTWSILEYLDSNAFDKSIKIFPL